MIDHHGLARRLSKLERRTSTLWPQPCLTFAEAIIAVSRGDARSVNEFRDSEAGTAAEWLKSEGAAGWCSDLLLDWMSVGHLGLFGDNLDDELVKIGPDDVVDAELVEEGLEHHFAITETSIQAELLEITIEDARAAGYLKIYRDLRVPTDALRTLLSTCLHEARQEEVPKSIEASESAAEDDSGADKADDWRGTPMRLLSAAEICRTLGIDPRSSGAKELLADIPKIQIGQDRWRYRASEVVSYLDTKQSKR